MKGRVIKDLHGSTYKLEDYNISFDVPQVINKGEEFILTRDRVLNQSFILVRFGEQRGYIYTKDNMYIYGLLKTIGYNPKEDLRSK